MSTSIQELSKPLTITAFVSNDKHKEYLKSLFPHTVFENDIQNINNILMQESIDLLFLHVDDTDIVDAIKKKYPHLEVVIILNSQTNEELKKLLQANVGAIDLDNPILTEETLSQHITKINDKKHTQLRIISLEDKIYEFKKLLDIYGENVIASVTDKKGIIKFASQAFCDIGNYEKKDLVGKSHNVIRHPDMPKEVFKDLWHTIKSGKVWKGEIKNRKKHGGFYWVYATISPETNIKGEIIGYSAIRQDITDKKYIEELSITDSLTLLYNHRHFGTVVDLQLKHAHRYDLELNFLLLDLDYFKQYNDTYGHLKGDTALQKVALAIKHRFQRPDDFCFRLGGEELGILYYTKTKEDAVHMSNHLKKDIEDLHIIHENNKASKYLSFSAGLYIINKHKDTRENLYECCDKALYEAKHKGRNQIVVFTDDL